MPLIERYRSQAADLGMAALWVVEAFDVIRDVPTRFFPVAIDFSMNPLWL